MAQTAVQIAFDKWSATVPDDVSIRYVLDPQPGGITHCRLSVRGQNRDAVRNTTQSFLDRMAGGKEAFIRAAVEVGEDRDFATKEHWFKGHVRFSVTDHAGEWRYPSKEDYPMIESFGRVE